MILRYLTGAGLLIFGGIAMLILMAVIYSLAGLSWLRGD